ncbi:hypothetical protein PENTCL1PPCAC_2449, partial [Pristionchus entomophagus]
SVRYSAMSAFRGEEVSFSQADNVVVDLVLPHESIVHTEDLSDHYNNLFMSSELSDVTLVVEGKNLPGHKVILAARSKYFRCLFFGGMREEKEDVIELKETPLEAFTDLLKYIYTGRLCLHGMTDNRILDILMLANRCDFQRLQKDIALFFSETLTTSNVCTVLHVSQLYSLPNLIEDCFVFADKNATDILLSPAFLSLSASAIEELIIRDSFCADEIDIFNAICRWNEARPQESSESLSSLVSRLRLPLISLNHLLDIVRPSGLIASDTILDAIKEQCGTTSSLLTHRGFLSPDVNVATSRLAEVIVGDSPSALFLNNETSAAQDGDRIYTRHYIEDDTEGIVVKLSRSYIINKIVLGLWADRETRLYSYYVEVSVDRKDWIRIIDHTKYLCRSKQTLLFPKRAVKYIRVVGTHNSLNRLFHLVYLEALYTTEAFNVDPATKLSMPSMNVASAERHAMVIEGVSRVRNALISGISHYDWDEGYTCHQLGSGSITVQLPQPYLVSSIRLLLWDCDERNYSYYIEVSVNQLEWKRVVDRENEDCRSWQCAEFPPEPVVFIRIVGTANSANEVFHCVHLQCPASPSLPQESSVPSLPTLPILPLVLPPPGPLPSPLYPSLPS